ncbi:hypothetical protein NKH47_26025 [Mesorhizobium sp. M1060]|uniref:hypothetical protein n=1 Tax=Mesorhizobium sp. M1060 TaxID=2957052 RepID=UPI00333E0C2E
MVDLAKRRRTALQSAVEQANRDGGIADPATAGWAVRRSAFSNRSYDEVLEELIAPRPEVDAWMWRLSDGEMPPFLLAKVLRSD